MNYWWRDGRQLTLSLTRQASSPPGSYGVWRIAARVTRPQQRGLPLRQPRPPAAQLGKRSRTLPKCRAPPARGAELRQRAEALRQRGAAAAAAQATAVQAAAVAVGSAAGGFGAGAPLEHKVLYQHLQPEKRLANRQDVSGTSAWQWDFCSLTLQPRSRMASSSGSSGGGGRPACTAACSAALTHHLTNHQPHGTPGRRS